MDLVDIHEERSAFAAAMRRGDAAAAAAIYSDDATLLAPAVDVVRGRTAIERFWQTGVDTGITEVELDALDLQRSGDIAFEVGRYELRIAAESGTPVVDRGRYLIVHRVESDGHWRRAAEMFSPDTDGGNRLLPGGEPASPHDRLAKPALEDGP